MVVEVDETSLTYEKKRCVGPFSVDYLTEFEAGNIPSEKRGELAMVARNRKMDFVHDITVRTVRLQASAIDMDQTLQKAQALIDKKADFVISSTHETASGRTEITVRRYPPTMWVIVSAVVLLVVVLMLR